jgi:hypothetical protein
LPITSARRFSPLGLLGAARDSFLIIAKRVPWATIPVTFDAILMDQSATSRIDPLLIAETTKEMLCNLGFGESWFTDYERQDVVCKRHASKHT